MQLEDKLNKIGQLKCDFLNLIQYFEIAQQCKPSMDCLKYLSENFSRFYNRTVIEFIKDYESIHKSVNPAGF